MELNKLPDAITVI